MEQFNPDNIAKYKAGFEQLSADDLSSIGTRLLLASLHAKTDNEKELSKALNIGSLYMSSLAFEKYHAHTEKQVELAL